MTLTKFAARRRWIMLAPALLAALGLAQPAVTARRAAPHASAPRPAPAPNWTTRITLGPGGSHIVGNPAAPVRLTEWSSYTCPHCAHFAAEADGPLRHDYVAGGRVSYEIRHLVRDPIDFAMAIAANCGPMSGFLARHEGLMSAQGAIIARVQALPQSTFAAWQQVPVAQRVRRVADDSGVTQWMRDHGISAAAANACLADEGLQRRLVAMTNQAGEAGINSTPSFAINGTVAADVHSWDALHPVLDAAKVAHP